MKNILIIVIFLFVTSCNPYMHIGGNVMRNYNTSMNKYKKNNSYLDYNQLVNESNKPIKKQRENKFLFWLWRNI